VPDKVPGKLKESGILFTHRMENPNGAESTAGQADDSPPRAAELTLNRLRAFSRQPVMLLEKPL
jgi:hypothetical protein